MNYYLLGCLAFIIIILTVFFLSFEKKHPEPRDILPIVTLCILASLGRILFNFLPQIQPVTAIVILTGICYKRQAGFLTGSLCAFTSNLILGLGPWTIWQMFAWGAIGFVAGFIPKDKIHIAAVFSLVSAFFFSLITDMWTLLSMNESLSVPLVLTVLWTGIVFNIGHAIGNVIFIYLLYPVFVPKLNRLQIKYGINKC